MAARRPACLLDLQHCKFRKSFEYFNQICSSEEEFDGNRKVWQKAARSQVEIIFSVRGRNVQGWKDNQVSASIPTALCKHLRDLSIANGAEVFDHNSFN